MSNYSLHCWNCKLLILADLLVKPPPSASASFTESIASTLYSKLEIKAITADDLEG